jgi:pilus assembly protein FimV
MVIDANDEGTKHVEAALDLDMGDIESAELEMLDDSAIAVAEDEVAVSTGEDDITEFRPAEMTGEFEVPELHQTDETEAVEEAVSAVDAEAGLERTGTFAPGDFSDDEVEAAMEQGVDDIEDLMLPDDVDEVGTKLDLAKAFIDMGDAEGARSSLEEVLEEGTVEQKAEATGLLEQIK